MIFDFNILAILTIIVGIVALFFFIIDKYPMESVSIGLLSALAFIQVIFSNQDGFDIATLLSGFANPGLNYCYGITYNGRGYGCYWSY